MNPGTDILPPSPGRSWRTIRQEVQPLAMSRQGRRRQMAGWVKAGAVSAFVAGLGWGLYALVHSWATDRAGLATAVHSAPVGRVALITDGVLTQKWAEEMLALPKTASLMALDLPALRDKLLAHGQVRVAVLTRSFPATLVVTLQERTPVARVQADTGVGAAQPLLVAKDGVVYAGLNYDPSMLAGLPWLDGIRLVRAGRGFEPITGMADVSELLSTAQLQAPHLYREWLIVSLARLAETDELLVKTQDIPEIVFTRKRAFFKQVAQLDYIIDRAHALPEPALKSVNLTLEGQVPVVLETAATATVPPKAPPSNFLLQPSQRKAKRDL
ncbi:MAG: FtsQ-type POTRA domain-containing protein [Opitutae bacterium]